MPWLKEQVIANWKQYVKSSLCQSKGQKMKQKEGRWRVQFKKQIVQIFRDGQKDSKNQINIVGM